MIGTMFALPIVSLIVFGHLATPVLSTTTNFLCASGQFCSGNNVLLPITYSNADVCMNACLAQNSATFYFDLYFTGSNLGRCYCGLQCGRLEAIRPQIPIQSTE